MAKNIESNTPLSGINKDSHISALEEGEYTNALNSNLQSKDGGKYYLTSDPSNLLTTEIKKEGYKVVGNKVNYNKKEVYLFITNPYTGLSEIGKVEMISNEKSIAKESEYVKRLKEEDKTLEELSEETLSYSPGGDSQSIGPLVKGFKEYETIVKDCHENMCLGFDIDKPIHTIEVRNEVSGTKISWTFGDMPMTIDLGRIEEYYYKGNEFCGESDKEEVCLNCDKMKVFRDYKHILLREDSLTEGNLDKAKYEFFAAYCSQDGVEETEYHSQTVTINLNDVNNTQIEPKDLETNSGNGIKLRVDYIDPTREYFKVVVSKTRSSGTRYFVIGVYNSATEEIVLDRDPREGGQEEITSTKVRVEKTPHYNTSERIKEVDGTLTHINVTKEKEWNLQPVVNLMGFFAEWATIEVSEEFYKNQLPSETMKTVMRDEAYPYSISFSTNSGYETPKMPLISRPAMQPLSDYRDLLDTPINSLKFEERRSVFYEDPEGEYQIDGVNHSIKESDKDTVESVLNGKTDCASSDRTEHWQYYNTAGEGIQVESYKPSSKRATGDEYVYVISEEVGHVRDPEVTGGGFKNPCDEEQTIYFGFKFVINADIFGDYEGLDNILNNYQDIIKAFCKTGEDLTDSDKTILYLKYLLTGKWEDYLESPNAQGVPFPEEFGQDCDCSSDCESNDCNDIEEGVCCECPEEKEEDRTIEIREIQGESLSVEYKDVKDYSNGAKPNDCYIMETNDEGNYIYTEIQEEHFLANNSNKPFNIYKRLSSSTGNSQSSALSIIEDTNEVNIAQPSYHLDYEAPVPEYNEYESGNIEIEQSGVPDYRELYDRSPLLEPEKLALGWDQQFDDGVKNFHRGHSIIKGSSVGDSRHYMDTRFYPGISTRAAWFKMSTVDIESAVIKMSKFNLKKINSRSPFGNYGGKGVESVRVSIYTNMQGSGLKYSKIISTKRDFKEGFNFYNNTEGTEEEDIDGFRYIGEIDNNELFIVIDTAITRIDIKNPDTESAEEFEQKILDLQPPNFTNGTAKRQSGFEMTWHNAPEGCFTISYEEKQVIKTTISFDATPIDIQQTYKSICHYSIPDPDDCNPQLYNKGIFAYTESTEMYPNNKELYDSSGLIITEEDIDKDIEIGGVGFKELFKMYCTEGEDPTGKYLLKGLDFTCQKIRHFKYPDNSISPMLPNFTTAPFADTSVFPIGLKLDEEVINTFLDLALKNDLITKKQRDEIDSYTIYIGDRAGNKSVISKGLSFDMYKYEEDRDIHFSNFPFNTLGNNIFVRDKNNKTIQHPYNNEGNNRFTIMTPELYNSWEGSPTEMKVEGYMYGNSENKIAEVKEHPKQVILGTRSRALATKFAIYETLAEIVLEALTGAETYRFGFGLSFTINPVGIIQTVATVVDATRRFVSRMGRYRYQWLTTFSDLGKPVNFAYRTTGVGKYTNITVERYKNKQEKERIYDNLRGIASSSKLGSSTEIIPDIDGKRDYINNIDREQSIYVKIKGFKDYPKEYSNYDNSDLSQATSGRVTHTTAATEGVVDRKVSSPYVSLKNYLPSQYGKISNIRWSRTGYTKKIGKDYKGGLAEVVFGGDIYIARFADIRKASLFSNTAMGLSDRTPFEYSRYPMYGDNITYYLDHKVNSDGLLRSEFIPDIKDKYNLDRVTGKSDFYVKEPSKFYLYNYGIINYIVESEYNPFYRYSEKGDTSTLFYPQTKDYVRLTEESVRPIADNNTLLYNRVYRQSPSSDIGRTFSNTYNDKEEEYKARGENTVVTSQKNISDFKTYDPWKIYRASDLTSYDTNEGKLKDVLKLTSNQVVLRFENNLSVINSQADIRDQTDPLGADIFKAPKVGFANSQIGYAGTDNASYLETEYGTVVLDTLRGDIFIISANPSKAPVLQEISKVFNKKSVKMDRWFKENLPFKILTTDITNYKDINIDNNFNGIGIAMGYDTLNKQLFITKKDFLPIKEGIEYIEGEFYHKNYDYKSAREEVISENGQEGWTYAPWQTAENKYTLTFYREDEEGNRHTKNIRVPGLSLYNEEFFEDVSWTITFSFENGRWNSFFSFKPNYYVNTPNYFQTGINEGQATIWTHGMTNRSFNTYYNESKEWGVTMPTNFAVTDNRVEVIKYMMESKRHQGEGYHNYVMNERIGMDRATITGLKSSSGELLLKPIEVPWQRSLYPKKIQGKASQEIPQTYSRGTWSFNYFYDRLKEGNQIWDYKNNGHERTLVDDSHDYSRRSLKRMEDIHNEIELKSQDTKHNKQIIVELIDETPKTER